ncbi:MAG: carboxypeptidase-like regulatory domain-containing protein [Bacteroidota bacterium]
MLSAACLLSKKIKAVASLFIICLLVSFHTKEEATIKGNIHNAKDASPLPFVTVQEKGTKNITASNTEGSFVIKVSKLPVILVFSAVGFDSKEITVKDSNTEIVVSMNESASRLDEVVVVGYGTEKGEPSYTWSDASKAGAITPGASATFKERTSGVIIKGEYASVPGKVRKSLRPDKPVAKAKTADRSPLTYEHDSKSMGVYDSVTISTTDKPIKRTSLLTAGEVNDFKKWKMWEDYNETDFKTHSDKWNLYATQRYSIQLQNNNFKAVVGETIYLINKDTKKIIWTAISDNTGKAELWNGFSNNSKEKNLVLEIKGEKKQFAAIPFSQGINHIQLNRSCTVSNKVEIAFVVDATGSMQDEIDYLKEELDDILTKFSAKNPALELSTGAIFYRDKGDDYVTRMQPFSNNISNTIDFIKTQSSGGGGDYPEALKEALEDATEKLEWNETARTKIIFLLLDAPPHDETKNEMAKLIANAAAKGIRIVPVACSGTDKATEFILRSMALATNGTYLFLTDDSGIGNGHIKPTTDEFKVELLNDLLQRTMEQMCFANTCDEKKKTEEPFSIYTNNEKVKVFPNPTKGPVTLETDKELKEIFVADFTGKLLMRIVVKDVKKQYNIDLSDFPSATYFIRYITKENKTGAEKIILIH